MVRKLSKAVKNKYENNLPISRKAITKGGKSKEGLG
jgi:hypothetical protein